MFLSLLEMKHLQALSVGAAEDLSTVPGMWQVLKEIIFGQTGTTSKALWFFSVFSFRLKGAILSIKFLF